MLWLKAWLETRSRVVFVLVWGGSFLFLYVGANSAGVPGKSQDLRGLLGAAGFLWLFTPLYLSGSGIRTQPPFGRPGPGLHGSTQYTLSLPVSRARLLLTRTALGLVETAALVVVFSLALWAVMSGASATPTPGDWIGFALTAFVFAAGVYGVAMIAAALVDDAWIISLGTVALVLLWVFQLVGVIPPAANIFRPLSETSPLVTHTMPWVPMAVSLAICAAGVLTALRIVNRQEF